MAACDQYRNTHWVQVVTPVARTPNWLVCPVDSCTEQVKGDLAPYNVYNRAHAPLSFEVVLGVLFMVWTALWLIPVRCEVAGDGEGRGAGGREVDIWDDNNAEAKLKLETRLSHAQTGLKKVFTMLLVFLETLDSCWHLQSLKINMVFTLILLLTQGWCYQPKYATVTQKFNWVTIIHQIWLQP